MEMFYLEAPDGVSGMVGLMATYGFGVFAFNSGYWPWAAWAGGCASRSNSTWVAPLSLSFATRTTWWGGANYGRDSQVELAESRETR